MTTPSADSVPVVVAKVEPWKPSSALLQEDDSGPASFVLSQSAERRHLSVANVFAPKPAFFESLWPEVRLSVSSSQTPIPPSVEDATDVNNNNNPFSQLVLLELRFRLPSNKAELWKAAWTAVEATDAAKSATHTAAPDLNRIVLFLDGPDTFGAPAVDVFRKLASLADALGVPGVSLVIDMPDTDRESFAAAHTQDWNAALAVAQLRDLKLHLRDTQFSASTTGPFLHSSLTQEQLNQLHAIIGGSPPITPNLPVGDDATKTTTGDDATKTTEDDTKTTTGYDATKTTTGDDAKTSGGSLRNDNSDGWVCSRCSRSVKHKRSRHKHSSSSRRHRRKH